MDIAIFKVCPFCKEQIRKEAGKCRFCGEWLEDRDKQRVDPITGQESQADMRRLHPNQETIDPVGSAKPPSRPEVAISESCAGQAAGPTVPQPDQESYWYGYIYSLFWAYATYCCFTHFIATALHENLKKSDTPEAPAEFWASMVLWLTATVVFAWVTYRLFTKRVTMRMIYSLVAIHGVSVVMRGIIPVELLLYIILSGCVIFCFKK